jgi:hypothetical protein
VSNGTDSRGKKHGLGRRTKKGASKKAKKGIVTGGRRKTRRGK